jgi:hypothetical protein
VRERVAKNRTKRKEGTARIVVRTVIAQAVAGAVVRESVVKRTQVKELGSRREKDN